MKSLFRRKQKPICKRFDVLNCLCLSACDILYYKSNRQPEFEETGRFCLNYMQELLDQCMLRMAFLGGWVLKLNMEQRRIVELEPGGHMLVKGVAGSGKTTVAVRRIPFLLNHYCHEKDDRVLLVTFNKTLRNYIKFLYNKVEDETEYQTQLFDGVNQDVTITTIDSLMNRYFQHCRKAEGVALNFDRKLEYSTMIFAINQVREQHPDIKMISPKNSNFLLDEINWIKACNIDDEEMYQNIDRIGRASGGKGIPQKLEKNSELRGAIFKLMISYDKLLRQQGYVDFKRMNILALNQARIAPMEKYTHILIDESQDLTKVQLEFLRCIYQEKKYSSIMFVADNTQSIYSDSWLGKGRPYTTIGYDMSGRSRTLSKNYRTTTEISRAAYGLIEHDENIKNNVDFVRPSLIDRSGHPPVYRYFRGKEAELEWLASEIEELQGDYGNSDICIVARLNRSVETAKDYLEKSGIPCEILNQQKPDFDSDKVKLVTFHSIKGLEFRVIFLMDLNEGVIPNTIHVDYDDEDTVESEERRLFYVGMTRANELLYMSSSGKPSKFIRELDHSHLRIRRDVRMRPFKSYGTHEYLKTDQIMDINAREELVRQWLIRELNETYGYPLELMQLEHPVQQFSRKGFVDVAVNISHKGEEMPYIFAETKSFGTGIADARDQLKSYMATSDSVRYGLVTDGLELLVMGRDGEVLNDIPVCSPHFLPDLKERREYLNFRNSRQYSYAFDKEREDIVEITNPETGLAIEYPTMAAIPVAGEVAAGIPTAVNQEFDEFLTLPGDWLISEKETFALKVTGNSMNGIGINIGDLAIVHQQHTAQNGDIVIAIIGQEATLKKFMLMGDLVLLISENNDYEPIQMKREDVTINGKVIGVLKS